MTALYYVNGVITKPLNSLNFSSEKRCRGLLKKYLKRFTKRSNVIMHMDFLGRFSCTNALKGYKIKFNFNASFVCYFLPSSFNAKLS